MNQKTLHRICLGVSLLLFGIALTNVAHAQDQKTDSNWPVYRGVQHGHAIGANIPLKIGEDKNVKWKTPIHGRGWSSPVIWGEQVWLTTATPDGKKMSVICVDLKTGKVLRDSVLHENAEPAFCHPVNSYASPTPAIEEGRVYIHFGSYGTTCLNTKTGEVIWQRLDLKCDHFRGPGSSPILFENMLIVAFDGFDEQYVVALDKETGKTIWKTDREIDYGTDNGDLMKAYCTGSVFDVDGKSLLVYPSAVATVAYDVKTGEPVWTAYHEGMNASARPVITNNGLVILTNGMGKMVAVDPKGSGNITESNIKWRSAQAIAKKSSQLIIGDRVFMVSDKGVATCLNQEDGEPIWQERLGGKYAASPVFDGEKIMAISEDGLIKFFKAGDKFELLGKTKLGDGFMASPAISGNQVVLRSLSHLYCVSTD